MASPFWYELNRDVVVASGADARSFLHSQLSNDIATLAVGESRHSLLLDPTGKVTSLVRVHCVADDEFSLDTDTGFGEITAQRLARFKIRVKCELSTTTRTFIALRGLSVSEHASLLAQTGALSAWRAVDRAVDFVSTETKQPPANIRQGATDEYERARVLAHWPQMGIDMTSDSIYLETGLTDVAVSFTKGCYPGQELVERMDSRGSAAPRSLRVIRATPGAVPGASVVVDGQEVGIYTSVAGDVALALIKRNTDSRSLEIVS